MRAPRGLALAGLIGLLAGCDAYQGERGSALSYATATIKSMRSADAGKAAPITRAELDALPGPLLQAEIESRDSIARMSFLAANGPYETWSSVDSATITLKQGILVATRALGADLMSADVVQIQQMLDDPDMPEGTRVHRYLDGEGHLITQSYLCEITDRRPDRLDILGETVAVTRITESCHSPQSRFENVYWREAGGRIRAARHWVGPDIGAISTVLLKG